MMGNNCTIAFMDKVDLPIMTMVTLSPKIKQILLRGTGPLNKKPLQDNNPKN